MRQSLILDCVSMLSAGGVLALVVVDPLHPETEATLSSLPGQLWQRRETGHAIFHYRSEGPAADRDGGAEYGDLFAAYVRSEAPRTLAGDSVLVRSVFGLPDFDTCSYLTQLFASVLAARPADEWERWHRIWVWNPGQGDLATWLLYRRREKTGGAGSELTVASRDALQLYATETNVITRVGGMWGSVHAPSPAIAAQVFARAVGEAGGADLMVVPVEQDVARTQGATLLATLVQAVAPGGHLIVGGKSGLVGPILQQRQAAGGLNLIKQTRRNGQAAAICVRSA